MPVSTYKPSSSGTCQRVLRYGPCVYTDYSLYLTSGTTSDRSRMFGARHGPLGPSKRFLYGAVFYDLLQWTLCLRPFESRLVRATSTQEDRCVGSGQQTPGFTGRDVPMIQMPSVLGTDTLGRECRLQREHAYNNIVLCESRPDNQSREGDSSGLLYKQGY